MKSISTAEKLAERGFTLLEQQVFPTPYNARLIAAMVAFGPPGTTADDIVEALADCAEVKQVLPIFSLFSLFFSLFFIYLFIYLLNIVILPGNFTGF